MKEGWTFRVNFGIRQKVSVKDQLASVLRSTKLLVQSKASSFWKDDMKSAGNNSRRVWRTVDNLLGEAKSGPKVSVLT